MNPHAHDNLAHADRIDLQGIKGHGRHGVFDFERDEGQEFLVDVTVFPTEQVWSAAVKSDDIGDAVDYSDVASTVLAHITGEPVNLIETLATRIADDVLAAAPAMHVCVTVHKPQAPLSMDFSDVSVTVHRSRSS